MPDTSLHSTKTAVAQRATVIVMEPVTAARSIPASGQGRAASGVDRSHSMHQLQRFVTVAVVAAVFATAGCTAAPGLERANEAWSQRLTKQSESIQAQAARQERSQAAWSARLSDQAQAYLAEEARVLQAKDAWSLRLTRLAETFIGGGSGTDRASQAWSDRLNGLAESAGAID